MHCTLHTGFSITVIPRLNDFPMTIREVPFPSNCCAVCLAVQEVSYDNCAHATDAVNGCVDVCDEGKSNPSCDENGTQDTAESFVDVCTLALGQRRRSVCRPPHHSGQGADDVSKMADTDSNKDVNEWHQVARVLDRLFLVIYLILTGVYAFVVFGVLI